MKKWIAFTSLLLCSCASVGERERPPMPSATGVTSLAVFTRQLHQSIEDPKVLAWSHALPSIGSGPREEPDYIVAASSGCSVNLAYQSNEAFEEVFAKICTERGGRFQQTFCRDTSDSFRVLFYASSRGERKPSCPAANEFAYQLVTIEPKNGAIDSGAYVAELRAHGFRTREDMARVKSKLREDLERMRQGEYAEQERVAKELPLLRTRGTKICRTEGSWLTVAYVEGVEPKKIQLRISNVGLQINPNVHPGGWSGGQIIWDFPERWRVCE